MSHQGTAAGILDRAYSFLSRNARPGTILVLSAAALAITGIFQITGAVLRGYSPTFVALDGPRLIPYLPSKAFQIVDNLGQDGRLLYLSNEWTLDLIYPFVYSFLLSFLIIDALRLWLSEAANQLRPLALLPFGALVTDLLENTGIAILLLTSDQDLTGLASATGIFTVIKWGFAAVSVITLLALLLCCLVKFIIQVAKRSSSPT
jgi:hypothetical protein